MACAGQSGTRRRPALRLDVFPGALWFPPRRQQARIGAPRSDSGQRRSIDLPPAPLAPTSPSAATANPSSSPAGASGGGFDDCLSHNPEIRQRRCATYWTPPDHFCASSREMQFQDVFRHRRYGCPGNRASSQPRLRSDKIGTVNHWWLEVDDDGTPQREIGFDR